MAFLCLQTSPNKHTNMTEAQATQKRATVVYLECDDAGLGEYIGMARYLVQHILPQELVIVIQRPIRAKVFIQGLQQTS